MVSYIRFASRLFAALLLTTSLAYAGLFDDPSNLEVLPEMIEHILTKTVADEGLESAIQEYRELREPYYGGYTFDFSERMLTRIAENYGVDGAFDEALGFVNLNLEFFPESSISYVLRTQVRIEMQDTEGAREDYRKALEIEADSAFIKRQLAALD